MPESIELQVSLELQKALQQADTLRTKLQQSVKPDSSAYKEIESLINRVSRQAELFKRTMNNSLTTSSGTKTFTNNLQKTFDLLGVATDKLANVRGKDLIFSDHDVQTIQQMEQDLADLTARINQIKSGKIGNFLMIVQFHNFDRFKSSLKECLQIYIILLLQIYRKQLVLRYLKLMMIQIRQLLN